MDTKAWYASKTIWGAIVMMICTLLQLTGVAKVTAEEQSSMTDLLVGFGSVAGQLVGGIFAIYGRIKAKTVVGMLMICFLATGMLTGCAGTQTVKPYEIGKATAESILYEARVMQNSGKLSTADFEKIKRYYDRYKLSQDFIIDTRIALIKSYDANQKLQYDVALRNLPLLLKDLMDMAAGFGIHFALAGGE